MIAGRGAEMSSARATPSGAAARSRASSALRWASLSATLMTPTRPGATLILARGSSPSSARP
ncbi:MAG TPA: hypothetical protein VM891_00275 [Amaricoccus sp.]|nr:hypothetical protein [Amaricoccus sp.]